MEYVLSAKDMRLIDNKTSEEFGIDAFTLMERAALETAKIIKDEFGLCEVSIFSGSGNNGGDGIALARILWEMGYSPKLYVLGDVNHLSALTKKQIDIISKFPIEVNFKLPDSIRSDLCVDALFGIGLNRNVEGNYKDAINLINSSSSKKLAIDIPSGINADDGKIMGEAVDCDITVTYGAKKIGQILYPGRKFCGKLICVQIGIPVSLFGKFSTFIFEEKEEILPERNPYGNKGTFGKVLTIAGSKEMGGACILSAKATFRLGAGMVKIYTATENRDLILQSLPEAMVDTYVDDFSRLQESLNWCDVVVLGPGLSTGEVSKKLVSKTIELINKPIIIDADALNIISLDKNLLSYLKTKNVPVILTPHLGEFSRLSGLTISEIKKDMINICKKFAADYNVILTCKDACTIVTDGYKVFLNTSGNDGMATAGSGDVLTGIIAALLAQKCDTFEAAIKGVFLHGKAGDIAKDEASAYYMIADDIIKALSKFN